MEDNEKTRILNMLKDGKITVDEALKLLEAIETRENPSENSVILKDSRGRKAKKLRVVVDAKNENSEKKDKVNISIPISIIKTVGPLILKSMPKESKQKLEESGVDLAQILADIDSLVESGLDEDIVNVDTADGDKVRIYFE